MSHVIRHILHIYIYIKYIDTYIIYNLRLNSEPKLLTDLNLAERYLHHQLWSHFGQLQPSTAPGMPSPIWGGAFLQTFFHVCWQAGQLKSSFAVGPTCVTLDFRSMPLFQRCFCRSWCWSVLCHHFCAGWEANFLGGLQTRSHLAQWKWGLDASRYATLPRRFRSMPYWQSCTFPMSLESSISTLDCWEVGMLTSRRQMSTATTAEVLPSGTA